MFTGILSYANLCNRIQLRRYPTWRIEHFRVTTTSSINYPLVIKSGIPATLSIKVNHCCWFATDQFDWFVLISLIFIWARTSPRIPHLQITFWLRDESTGRNIANIDRRERISSVCDTEINRTSSANNRSHRQSRRDFISFDWLLRWWSYLARIVFTISLPIDEAGDEQFYCHVVDSSPGIRDSCTVVDNSRISRATETRRYRALNEKHFIRTRGVLADAKSYSHFLWHARTTMYHWYSSTTS